MSKMRRQYSREFKVEAAKLSYNSDKPGEQIAKDLGISQSSLTAGGVSIGLIQTKPFRARAK